jgi:putative tricarboxylic transport membrane protein
MGKSKADIVAAVCLALFGVYVISVASRLDYVSEVGPGPGFFPLWLGIGLVVFGAGLIAASFSHSPRGENATSWTTAGRSLTGWLGLMVAVALLGKLGFALVFVLLTVFFVAALDRRPILLALGIGVGLAVAFQLIFVVALDVSLPTGWFGF